MTRQEMEEVIDRGESVLYQGRIITLKENLPGEAELAQGDEGRIVAARETLLQQQQAITAQLAALDTTTVKPADQQDGLRLKLAEAGYDTDEKIQAASDEDLLTIEGIGQATLKRIREGSF